MGACIYMEIGIIYRGWVIFTTRLLGGFIILNSVGCIPRRNPTEISGYMSLIWDGYGRDLLILTQQMKQKLLFTLSPMPAGYTLSLMGE